MNTNSLGLRQLPGNGVLARYGDLTLLCEARPGQHDRIGVLLEVLAEAAAAQDDGRALSRRLAGLVSSAPDNGFPALCAFGPADGGLATLVHGGAELTVTVNGQELRLAGRDAVTVLDRMITEPVESIRAAFGDRAVESDVDSAAAAEATEQPRVLGVYCKRAHFNDPTLAFCAVCGIAMAHGNRLPEWGDRPQLGVLVLDDGTTYPLMRELVIGRAPEADDVVAAGAANPVRLDDPLVSRLHARVVLRDWQVELIDAGSANGTFLLAANESTWTRLAPAEATTLTPGAMVAFGRRQFRYHSYRTSR